MEKPSGPVIFVPSTDFPQLLSLIRLTTASRCFFHNDSHSAMDVGVGPELEVVAAVEGAVLGDDAAVVVGAAAPPPPPHAGNTTAIPKTANIETTFREVAMPDRLLDGGTLDRTREWNRSPPPAT
jgi:hypothetical protein